MKKLIDILDEIKIRPAITKKEVFDAVYEFNPYLTYSVYASDTLKELITRYYSSYDSLEEFLVDSFNYEGNELQEAIKIIEDYYNVIRPGDVIVGADKLDVINYKTVEMICPEVGGTDRCFLVATKF